jgi:cytoskeletal protein CcmA (bactofilin family)
MDTQTATPQIPPATGAGRPRTGEGTAAAAGTITLGAHDQLIGKLVYDGHLHVQGVLEGEAAVTGDLHVDDGGTVKAKLSAQQLTVRGIVDGDAVVRDRLLIAGSGIITGDVKVGRLVIEDGAVLNGNVTMERVMTGGSPTNARAGAPAPKR